MNPLYILKVGTTYPATAARFGDFDAWVEAALANPGVAVEVLAIAEGAALPNPAQCAGVIITGSHAMVTDCLPWSVAVEQWLPSLLAHQVPVLGICYGHQLLARALGGSVDAHPAGPEIGTVLIRANSARHDDPLFAAVPDQFYAHVTHTQSVVTLPANAVILAASDHEAHQIVRFGDCAWGVQFHPEFDAAISRDYIQAQAAAITAAGHSVTDRLQAVTATPQAREVLTRFGQLVAARNQKI